MILDEFFDAIYCINLDERTDRWSFCQNQFESLNIKNVKRFSGKKNIVGEIGCRDSHISIISESKDLGYGNILILEDDFQIINFDHDKLKNSIETLKNLDWDFFYLGASIQKNGKLEIVSENLLRCFFLHTTHSYAINQKNFDFIINEGKKNKIIDVFYRNYIHPKGNSYLINPMMSIQRETYSDIMKTNIDYGLMLDNFNLAKKFNNISV
jgi:hypothetical protein